MPFYTYKCSHCERTVTEFKKISERDDPLKEPCPSCGTYKSIHRPVEASGFIYNPSGQIKTSDNFNDRLIEIKKGKGEGNTINTRRSAI